MKPNNKEVLSFNNINLGSCALKPINSIEKMKEVFQNQEVMRLTSVGDTQNKTISEERAQKLLQQFIKNFHQSGLSFYEIYAEQFLGIAGYFFIKEHNELFPEVCIYLLPQSQAKGLGHDIACFLIDNAFSATRTKKVFADAFPDNYSTKIIHRLGFVQRSQHFQYKPSDRGFGQIRYELLRETRGLDVLSQIIQKQNSNLIPLIHGMTKTNIERVRTLWYAHFNKGIMLSSGGVEESFVKMKQLINIPNLQSLHMYRSDRPESTSLTQEAIRQFLVEERVLTQEIDLNSHAFSFCFGSHEGFARIIRCLYHPKNNNGIFYPEGGYGILAAVASTMLPQSYSVHLVGVNRYNGEKIAVADLIRQIKRHPTAKTLFIDLKTTAGAIYTEADLRKIIQICKKMNIFLIADAAHIKMAFKGNVQFPDVAHLCKEQNFHEFVVLYTTSKTYGLERARVGFFVLSKQVRQQGLFLKIERDLYRVIGAGGDLSFEVAKVLFKSTLEERQHFIHTQNERHRYNLNLMLGYSLGANSPLMDKDLAEKIRTEIPVRYRNGIQGLVVVYKPEAGMQLKVSTENFQNKYLTNIRLFNAEIFSYALNKACGVVTLHSYQIMDSSGFGLRLSFSNKTDVKNGMEAIHHFVSLLSDMPKINPFMPAINHVEKIIYPTPYKKEQVINTSRKLAPTLNLFEVYKRNIRKQLPTYVGMLDKEIKEKIEVSARKIQFVWKNYCSAKQKRSLVLTSHSTPRSKL